MKKEQNLEYSNPKTQEANENEEDDIRTGKFLRTEIRKDNGEITFFYECPFCSKESSLIETACYDEVNRNPCGCGAGIWAHNRDEKIAEFEMINK